MNLARICHRGSKKRQAQFAERVRGRGKLKRFNQQDFIPFGSLVCLPNRLTRNGCRMALRAHCWVKLGPVQPPCQHLCAKNNVLQTSSFLPRLLDALGARIQRTFASCFCRQFLLGLLICRLSVVMPNAQEQECTSRVANRLSSSRGRPCRLHRAPSSPSSPASVA